MKKYLWTITISDSFCTYEYLIESGKQDVTIEDIANKAGELLGVKNPKGEYIDTIESYSLGNLR